MAEPRIQDLLEALLDSNRTPEEVCCDEPDLLPEVRERWNRMQAIEAEVEAMFPTPGTFLPSHSRIAASLKRAAEFPRIQGYEVQEVLGRGGMGVVYKARHLKLNRSVAIKMLLAGEYAGPRELARFFQESEAMASLRHENIVQVFDVGEADGRPFFTMEHVEGGTLADKLGGVPKPGRQAATLLATLAEAVQAAHDCGIVHRDLKPANVLLTRDGKPKISDCGIARRVGGDSGLTITGMRVGTPSYMAPEQALGGAGAAAPPVDIYSLGALLYEMVTGRPPFRGETPAETERQVISEEPVPPSRLNAKVPRDLETICLKCLNKDPVRRYISAAALADDIGRFLRGEAVAARPAGRVERGWRWCRRNPRDTSLVLLAIALVCVAGAGAWRLDRQRMARQTERAREEERTRRAIEGALDQSRAMLRIAQWNQSADALDQAAAIVEEEGPSAWRQSIANGRRDLAMARELDRIRQAKAIIVDGRLSTAAAPSAYAKAFGDYGVPISESSLSVDELAAKIRSSGIARELVDAISDWIFIEGDPGVRWRLVALAHAVDPEAWRDRARDPAVWSDRRALAEVIRDAPAREPSVQLLVALGERLQATDGDAVPFIRRVQREHPSDFWANFALGNALRTTDAAEAMGYYRAAIAIRPQAVVALYNLGSVLKNSGRSDEAIERQRQVIELDPGNSGAHNNLAQTLVGMGRDEQAIAEYELAVRLDPKNATAMSNLGTALRTMGRLQEALDSCARAAELEPQTAWMRGNLALVLQDLGRMDESISEHDRSVQLEPGSAVAHSNFAFALQLVGRPDDAIEHCKEALRIDPRYAKAHVNFGLALQDKGRTDEASVHYHQALAIDPGLPTAYVNLGKIAGEQGRVDEAMEDLQHALRLDPKLAAAHSNLGAYLARSGRMDEAIVHFTQAVRLKPTLASAHHNLGTALVEKGRFTEAQAAFQHCLKFYAESNPNRANAVAQLRQCDQWLVLEGRLSSVLDGSDAPVSGVEWFRFAELCRMQGRYASAVSLYANAFASLDSLSLSPPNGQRYNGACAASLAGSGAGRDAGAFTEEDRAKWRGQACAWLRTDLAANAKLLDSGDSKIAEIVRNSLIHWKSDPDLIGVRDPAKLDRLSTAEREEYLALWTAVDVLIARASGGN